MFDRRARRGRSLIGDLASGGLRSDFIFDIDQILSIERVRERDIVLEEDLFLALVLELVFSDFTFIDIFVVTCRLILDDKGGASPTVILDRTVEIV